MSEQNNTKKLTAKFEEKIKEANWTGKKFRKNFNENPTICQLNSYLFGFEMKDLVVKWKECGLHRKMISTKSKPK
jgi:hypothetical protein